MQQGSATRDRLGRASVDIDSATDVTISTAIELVTRLYTGTHALKGDFEQVSGLAAEYLPPANEERRTLLLRYFGADYSVGMSLVVLAGNRGWSSSGDLVDGVRGMTGKRLVSELLVSTTLNDDDQAATSELVHQALSDADSRGSLARKVARRNSYSAKDVTYLLDDPTAHDVSSSASFEWASSSFEDVEAEIRARLAGRVDAIVALVRGSTREQAFLELTGGWTLKDDTQQVVLMPTEALGSMVITRLGDDRRMLVAFGPQRNPREPLGPADLAATARALGSEQRIAILQQVGQEPASGQTLAKSLGLTQATVHYHTALLRSLGLLTSMRDAHSVVHSLEPDRLLFALTSIARAVMEDESIEVASKRS